MIVDTSHENSCSAVVGEPPQTNDSSLLLFPSTGLTSCSKLLIKGPLHILSSLSENSTDMILWALKGLLVAVIVPVVHSGHKEISS